jgi:capsular exopolysaccharide synthesis family protein
VKQLVLNKLFHTSKKQRNLIAYSFPESKIAEEYRTIRTNVHIVMEGQKNKIILVTSPNSNEGKSTTAANLAVSMAQQKEKVLLIDGNVRRPSCHFIFKKSNTVGLTDILTGKTSFEEAVIHTEIGRLAILTSGTIPNNPAELLSSRIMKDLLQKVANHYDVVLIDSSPVLEVADAKILAGLCNEVLLVLDKGKTKLENAAEAKKVLEFARAKIAGVIMNEK